MERNRSIRTAVAACVLSLALSATSPARTIYVDDNAPADFRTIQAAIDDANDGDTIIIRPGTYTGPGNRDISFQGKAIVVRSTDPHDPAIVAATIIDCQYVAPPPGGGGVRIRAGDVSVYRAFVFQSGEGPDARVEGLTIINAGVAESGGAILCRQASPRIVQCVFRGSQCSQRGGAVSIEDGSPRIEQCLFEQNRANEGGAIAGSSQDGRVWIVNCVIQDNLAESSGGGLHCGPNVIASGCLIARNQANGGQDLYQDSRFPEGGGGVFLADDGIQLVNCTIVGNVAQTGGGILCGCRDDREGLASLYNCIVWDNAGGESNQIVLSRCCGMCVREIAPVELRVYGSCILGTYTVTEDLPYFSWPSYGGYRWYAQDGDTIHFDPCFVSPQEGDYHLRPDSPCVDVGGEDSSVPGIAVDLDGTARRIDGDRDGAARVDMGAYEVVPISTPVIVASPRSIVFHVYDSERLAPAQMLSVTNRGLGPVQWTIDCNCPWLSVRPMGGTAGQSVELRADGTGLAPGTYEYALLIHEPPVVNSPFRVSVRLLIGRTLRVPGAFATLQEAVDAAQSGDLVLLADGIYTGSGNRDVSCEAKGLRIRSEHGPGYCLLDCNAVDAIPYSTGIAVSGQEEVDIEGLTIRRAYHGIRAYGGHARLSDCRIIECHYACEGYCGLVDAQGCEFSRNTIGLSGYHSDIRADRCSSTHNATGAAFTESNAVLAGTLISHNTYGLRFTRCGTALLLQCLITGNGRPWDSWTRTLDFFGTNPEIRNCTLVGNVDHEDQYWGTHDGRATVIDSILWDNSGLIENLLPQCDVAFSDVQGGWDGPGNVDADPRFVQAGRWNLTSTPGQPIGTTWVEGDYHLKSQAGRREAGSGSWVVDEVTSPCIDAGDPNSPVGGEPEPNGGRVNMGAYGGTGEASKSYTSP
jgi:hypothetical protein